jgi:hypothetical protein
MVLGTSESGGASTPSTTNSGTSPAHTVEAAAPASATQTHALPAESHGSLPYTGGAAIALLAAGALLLIGGLGLQRLLARHT